MPELPYTATAEPSRGSGAERVAVVPVLSAAVRRALLETTGELTPTVMQLLGLAMALLSQAYLGRLVDSGPNPALGAYAGHYAAFLLLGMALLDLQNAVVGGLAQRIRAAQLDGSLEGMLATPAPTALLLAALAVPEVLLALARMLLYAALGRLLFGLDFSAVNPLGVLAVLIAALAGFGAFALVAAALTMFLRRADPLGVLLAATSAIAGGVLYPRAILPRGLAAIGEVIPIAPLLDALRSAVVQGAGPLALARPLGHLAAIVLVVGPAGAWLFTRMVARARHDGSLTAY